MYFAIKTILRAGAGRDQPLQLGSALANFGCGITFHAAWDNYDFISCGAEVKSVDLRRPLPCEDCVYDTVYSAHTLEHLPRNEVPGVLAEFGRILKPGGILRIVVPDLELMARTYLEQLERAVEGDGEGQANHAWMSVEMIDQMTRTFRGGFMGRMWRSRPLPSRRFIEERLGTEAAAFLAAVDSGDSKFGGTIAPEDVFQMSSPSGADELAFRAKGEIHRWMYDRVFVAVVTGRSRLQRYSPMHSRCIGHPEFFRLRSRYR